LRTAFFAGALFDADPKSFLERRSFHVYYTSFLPKCHPTTQEKHSTLFRFSLYRDDMAVSLLLLPILPAGEKKKHLIFA
jgi:hypothetical protein